jgi:5'-nucleotidase
MPMTSPLRVLLTNDDGIEAPGLAALGAAFAAIAGVEVWVAAPRTERSTCSHGMTLGRPVFVREAGPRRYAVDGLPADCVYLALFGLMPERPHVVVSGVNHGANLGSDVIYSGTAAGAREATIRGIHGIAASLVSGDDFTAAAESAASIAARIRDIAASPAILLNLNYPGGRFDGPFLARLGERSYPEVVEGGVAPLTGERYYWLGGPPVADRLHDGTDGWLVARGVASATFLTLDQTLGSPLPGTALGLVPAPPPPAGS